MELRTFKKKINEGDIPGVCLFFGSEEYLKDHYLKMIRRKTVAQGSEQFNSIVLHEGCELQHIADACETMPVFSTKKLVVVRNSGAFARANTALSEGLPRLVAGLPSYINLVFNERDADSRLKTTKAVKKNGCVLKFDFQAPGTLVKWVVQTLGKMGKKIDYAAASKLVEYSRQEMYAILEEMHKVAAYTEDSSDTITINDIESVCTKSIKSRIFDLTDAIAARNRKRAFELLEEMTASREPVPLILFLIARQIRQILQMKHMLKKGTGRNQAAGRLKVPVFVVSKLIKQSKSFKTDELKDILKKCLNTDCSIKTGLIADITALQLLVADIAGKVKKANPFT